ncbi:hypothetical protein OG21DRAFT_1490551 [Imleria badia]|nr:hypothetical protein OG21DRAFT_1490551 [Imleria badia]
MHSPTLSNGSRHTVTSPWHPLSPGVDELDNKRTQVDPIKHGPPSPTGQHTPVPSSRHLLVPLRMQPTSHSPKSCQHIDAGHLYSSSLPAIVVSLPPHPRPISPNHSSHTSSSGPITLPPIATLSPAPTAPSPTDN